MTPDAGFRGQAVIVGLFFVSWSGLWAQQPAPAAAPVAAPAEELRLAVQTLRQQNDELRQRLQQSQAQGRVLGENLAIARTESELFQKRWAEAQLRAQTLGVDFADPNARQWQRQIIETIRSLYLAEAERQRLLEQLKALVAAAQQGGSLTAAVERAKQAIAASDQPAGTAPARPGGTLEAARLLDVNAALRVVVLGVGLEQGVRVGMPFVVLRHDRVVAELRVVEARRNICGALIESVATEVTLQADDEARVVGR